MDIVEIAKNYIGKVSYVFGADNLDGGEADCSSFTEGVYKKAGYDIGGNTNAQWTNPAATNVEKEDLQAGDLVFFANTYNSGYTDNVSHVGIYEGNDTFIHCSSAGGGVIESSLSTVYYSNHYLGAKRFLEENNSNNNNEDSTHWWEFSEKRNQLIEDILKVLITIILIAGGAFFIYLSVENSTKKGD